MHSEDTHDSSSPPPPPERGLGTVAVLRQLFSEPELPAPSRAAALVCLSGPDAGRTLPLAEASAELGRGPQAHLRLRDLAVSRRHARLRWQEHSWLVEDLGSPNGVWLNGRRLEAPSPLAEGDVLQVGRTLLRFQPPVQEPIPPPEPPPANAPAPAQAPALAEASAPAEPAPPQPLPPEPLAEPRPLPPASPAPPHKLRWEVWLIALAVATALLGVIALHALAR